MMIPETNEGTEGVIKLCNSKKDRKYVQWQKKQMKRQRSTKHYTNKTIAQHELH